MYLYKSAVSFEKACKHEVQGCKDTITYNGSFILSHDYKIMRFGPGVDTQFSHESGKSTECVKIELFLKEHSPLIRVQVESLFSRCLFK